MTKIRVLGVGLLLSLATACTVEQRPLGEEPEDGGSGGRGGSKSSNKAGSGTVLPGSGGTTLTSGGATQVMGGATQAEGGATQVMGGATQIMGGATQAEGGASSVDCFSPTSHPELAVEDPDAGCACDAKEPDQCVRTQHEGRPWDVALVCAQGRWQSVEDGPCGGGGAAACRINGVDYANGQLHVPDPYSCNECECHDGKLSNCTQRPCKAPEPCPEGTTASTRCLDCGPIDNCTLVETGCLDLNDGKGQFCG